VYRFLGNGRVAAKPHLNRLRSGGNGEKKKRARWVEGYTSDPVNPTSPLFLVSGLITSAQATPCPWALFLLKNTRILFTK